MSELSIISTDFEEGGEIPKNCGYKHGNEKPELDFIPGENEPFPWAMIMDDPDAMAAVGKVWVHWLEYGNTDDCVLLQQAKMILVKLVMVDLHLQMDDTHTSSNYMNWIQI